MPALVLSFFVLISLQNVLGCNTEVGRSRRSVSSPDQMLSNLFKDLLDDYDLDVIPMLAPSSGDKTNSLLLNFGVSVINLDMEKNRNLLTTNAWLKMSWMDFRLKWDPEMYGGLKVVRIPANKIWKPDMEAYNSVDASLSKKLSSWPGLAVVYSTGFVLLIPPVSFKTHCSETAAQSFSCNYKFGSWTYDGFHMDIVPFDNKTHLMLDNLSRESPFLVTSQEGDSLQTKFYSCCTEPYQSMTYNFTVRKTDELPPNVAAEEYFEAYNEGLLLSEVELTRMRGY